MKRQKQCVSRMTGVYEKLKKIQSEISLMSHWQTKQITHFSIFLIYHNLSKALEFIGSGKIHRCGCQYFWFGWILHYSDFNTEIFAIRAVLALHKNVFCPSYPQHIRGRHQLPAEQWEKTMKPLNRKNLKYIDLIQCCPIFLPVYLN